MRSRITFVVAALMGLAVAPAIAQGPPGGGMGGQGGFAARRMQMMLQGITLTADQQAKVDSIQKDYQAKMPAFTPGEMPDSASRAQRMELMRQQNMAIRGVLTPDQQAIFDKNVADMNARMRRPPQ